MAKDLDRQYLRMAKIWSENSEALRLKVGVLIVKGDMIISDGYNGTPSGFDNNCEYMGDNLELITKPHVLHAEANAITKLARSSNSGEGATLYTTISPCLECSKLIIQARIRRIVFIDLYRDTSGLDLLEMAGLVVSQVKI